jgi:peptide chain release factor subunit 1
MSRQPHLSSCQLGTSNSVKQHKLRKNIARLSVIEVKDKELISLYVPSNVSTEQTVATLKKDIKCTHTVALNVQKHFDEAQKQLIKHVKELKTIPQNGIVVFAGIFSTENSEKERLSVEEIIPPQPISAYNYQVDNHFHLEPLREMLRAPKIVGVLTLDSKQASYGLQNGEHLEVKESITSGIAGKTGKGGQSQRRYERERDMAVTSFFHRVAEHASKVFLKNNVNVIVLGGPGQTKNDFLKGEFLQYELANMVLGVVDTQSADKAALEETLEKSDAALQSMCGPEERKAVQTLMVEVSKPDGGLATYGLDAVLKALKAGEVRVVLVADDTAYGEVLAVCKKCGHPKSKIADNINQVTRELMSVPCMQCRGNAFEIEERDIIDILEDLATQTNASVEVISTASEEKTQLKLLGGIAALVRYRLA